MSSPYFTLPEFRYTKPKTIEEVVKVLDEYGENARILAGGIGLISFMKERLLSPQVVIDIKGIPELRRIEYVEGNGLHIGAAVTIAELQGFLGERVEIGNKYRALSEALPQISDSLIRNRSTLIGNICEALPYMDGYPPLIAFDAKLHSVSVKGEREIPVAEFMKGLAETELKTDEFITHVTVPEPPEGAVSGFTKFSSHSEFSATAIAALIRWSERRDERIARISYGSVSDTPILLQEAGEIFRGEGSIDSMIDRVVETALSEINIISDLYATADYRRRLIEVLTRRLLVRLFKEVIG